MMMMMMNCFCGMVEQRKAFSLISSRHHCQRSSPSRISDTPRAGFEPAQNLSSDFVEWSWAAVIITTPRRHSGYLRWNGCSLLLISVFSHNNRVVWKLMWVLYDSFIATFSWGGFNLSFKILEFSFYFSVCFDYIYVVTEKGNYWLYWNTDYLYFD